MRTSRNAWGASLTDASAAMEWELGSRVMNDIEVESNPFTRMTAVTTRIQRASKSALHFEDVEDFMDCYILVKDRPEYLYICNDVTVDGVLILQQIEPRLRDGVYDLSYCHPSLVEDYIEVEDVQ